MTTQLDLSAPSRQTLVDERARTEERITALSRDLGSIIDSTAGANSDDEHDPEGATIAFERAQVAALLDHARTRLTSVDEALARWDTGVYSTCASCERQIAPARLAARPTATTCIECATG